jgi:hypothetical protein
MKAVIAVDPGKKTGLALFTYDGDSDPVLVLAKEADQMAMAGEIELMIETARAQPTVSDIEVVYERFIINAQTVRNSQAPYSLEQIGIIKYVCHVNGIHPDKIFVQSPSDAKKMFSNVALRKLGYWFSGGEGHAMDAIRHGLLRLVKTGWPPKRLFQ